jgi:hypothetical protein
MTLKQLEALQQLVRKETLAAVFESELLIAAGGRQRLSRREMEFHIHQLRGEASLHAREAADE